MSVLLSAEGRQDLRKAVAAAIRARVKSGASTVEREAARYGKGVDTIRRWVGGDYPAFTFALRNAPGLGIDVSKYRAKASA